MVNLMVLMTLIASHFIWLAGYVHEERESQHYRGNNLRSRPRIKYRHKGKSLTEADKASDAAAHNKHYQLLHDCLYYADTGIAPDFSILPRSCGDKEQQQQQQQ